MSNPIQIKSTMTSLEIAESTGKQHADVLKSIRKMEEAWVKVSQSNFALSDYTNSRGRKQPMYELTKTQTLYVATKFNDEARAKLILRWEELENRQPKALTPSEMFLAQAQINVASEQRLVAVESKIAKIEAKTQIRPDYFTIAGYGTLNNVKVNITLASKLGRAASKICKEKGYITDTIPDPRFGKVKMYPENVLSQVFNNQL